MKRRVLFCLTLLICLARLLPSNALFSSEAVFSENPAMQCRAKQPFPFNAKQWIKKRLSSPPEPERLSVFAGRPADVDHEAPLHLNVEWTFPAPGEAGRGAILPARAASRVVCPVERNVFHPPPVV